MPVSCNDTFKAQYQKGERKSEREREIEMKLSRNLS
ncbi:hypothetical protein NC651_003529 [Populus alba x Populus x berolinensis]|nr:hypothetical protein NC651_003529 [Populus alba x Populus x berolinensis]